MNDLIERLRLGDGTSADHELLLEAADALEALAQPEQEPVAVKHMMRWVNNLKWQSDNGQHMNIPSGLSSGTCWELAIELENFIKHTNFPQIAINPEIVGYVAPQRTERPVDCERCNRLEEQAYDLVGKLRVANIKLSMRLPRTWVELTDDEIWEAYMKAPLTLDCSTDELYALARTVEAKLKDKNNV